MKFFHKNAQYYRILFNVLLLTAGMLLITVLMFSVYGLAFPGENPVSAEDENLQADILSTEPTGTSTAAENDGDTIPEEIVVSGDSSFLAHLSVDGKVYTYCYESEQEATVLDLLYRSNVYLGEEDEINYSLETPLVENISVEVGRVTYEEVVEQISIPYETEEILMAYSFSPSLNGAYASRYKNTAGVPGIREVTKRVKKLDGVAVETTVISDKVTVQPKDATVYIDASYLLNLGNGAPESYVQVLDCNFTAYTYADEGGITTATGDKTQVGYVAVDRSVIPMHSYLYIVMDNGYVYGYAYAKDTGGAIKGNKVDIFLPSSPDCYNFGRKTGKVYIISYGS